MCSGEDAEQSRMEKHRVIGSKFDYYQILLTTSIRLAMFMIGIFGWRIGAIVDQYDNTTYNAIDDTAHIAQPYYVVIKRLLFAASRDRSEKMYHRRLAQLPLLLPIPRVCTLGETIGNWYVDHESNALLSDISAYKRIFECQKFLPIGEYWIKKWKRHEKLKVSWTKVATQQHAKNGRTHSRHKTLKCQPTFFESTHDEFAFQLKNPMR